MDSTSRVKVEYTDPSNIFPIFTRDLSTRLPLNELYWSSITRPIRSINNLQLDLVSDEQAKLQSEPSSSEASAGNQENGLPSKGEGARKGRRHQIPGLRKTPYLKIYLLHCEDVETYRASSRKHLREWIKDHTPSQSTTNLSKPDNHDAYEWLIIHVNSASPDGSTNTSRPSSSAEKRSSSSRWPSRGSTSVIEKLRADFNSTSKNAIDRIAQIQLSHASIDTTAQANQRTEDGKNGWDDLIVKLKSLILASFDLRVSQYEDDIREREGQKKVFGWNFNTFFVLKEGLAMGFENLGLLDDALTVYRELAFGLEAAIEEQHGGGAQQQTAHFVDYTNDLYEAFKGVRNLTFDQTDEDSVAESRIVDPGIYLLDTDRKPFREMILSNKISVLDFKCYVFARETSLILRLANASSKRVRRKSAAITTNESTVNDKHLVDDALRPNSNDHGPENLLLLAEAVKSSTEFVTSTAQIIRQDVEKAIDHDLSHDHANGNLEQAKDDSPIDDFVSSWLFSASQCILEATFAESLRTQVDPLLREMTRNAMTGFVHVEENASKNVSAIDRKDLPARTSSLPMNDTQSPLPLGQDSLPPMAPANLLDGTKHSSLRAPYPGAQDLAAERGDVMILKRRILTAVSIRHHGAQVRPMDSALEIENSKSEMQEITLGEETSQEDPDSTNLGNESNGPSSAGLCNMALLLACKSEAAYYESFEALTMSALAHYLMADRKKAAQAMTADLAMARFHMRDYSVAASYFRRLAPIYAQDDWSHLEIIMLEAYARCLKHLNKTEEFVRIGLKVLGKSIKNHPSSSQQSHTKTFEHSIIHRSPLGTKIGLSTLVAASKRLNVHIIVPMGEYFDNIKFGAHIQHRHDYDGFDLALHLRSLLPEAFQPHSVRVRMVCTDGGQRSELWLTAEDAPLLKPGRIEMLLTSKMMQPGWYVVNMVQIQCSNVNFVLDLTPPVENPLLSRNRESMLHRGNVLSDQQSILVWPKPDNLEAHLTHYEIVNLEQPNSIKLEISSGRSDVLQGNVTLRPASAGLRLHTAEAMILDDKVEIKDKSRSGSISLCGFPRGTCVAVRIPYSLENDLREINVQVVVEYTTSKGNFAFACDASLPILLPLAINVQDSFKRSTLVSKFTIGTSSTIPLRILSCHLEGTQDFRIVSSPLPEGGLDVSVRQPLSILAKIHKTARSKRRSTTNRNKLFLKIEYRSLDTEIIVAVEQDFMGTLAITPFENFSCALRPFFRAALRGKCVAQDLENVATSHSFHIGTFSDWAWNSLLVGLPIEASDGLARWLRDWHDAHQNFYFDSFGKSSILQHLTVPVEVPRMQVVHTARLRSASKASSPNADFNSVPLGQGVPMELIISHTRGWDYEKDTETEGLALEFCFEVQANSDVWLIGGKRKGYFSAKEGEVLTVPLILWAQKTGSLLLPSVEIQSLPISQERSQEDEEVADSSISCDVDYQSAGEAILVVPNLISTTVSLDPSGAGGGWLVESRSKDP